MKGIALEEWNLYRLDSPEYEVRTAAAERLAEMLSVRAVPRLLKLLQDHGEEPVRLSFSQDGAVILSENYAGRALKEMGAAAIPGLLEGLKTQETGLEAASFLISLGHGAKPAIPLLIRFLAERNGDTCYMAAYVLGRLRPVARESVPALSTALKDRDPFLRRAASFALFSLGPDAKEAAWALRGSLKDADQEVRCSAAGALLKSKEAEEAATQVLLELLEGADEPLRRRAGEILGKAGQK